MYVNSTGSTMKNSTKYVGEQKVGLETDPLMPLRLGSAPGRASFARCCPAPLRHWGSGRCVGVRVGGLGLVAGVRWLAGGAVCTQRTVRGRLRDRRLHGACPSHRLRGGRSRPGSRQGGSQHRHSSTGPGLAQTRAACACIAGTAVVVIGDNCVQSWTKNQRSASSCHEA